MTVLTSKQCLLRKACPLLLFRTKTSLFMHCFSLDVMSGSTSLQKPRLQHAIKIQKVMGKMVSIIRRGLSRGNETVFFPGERITALSLPRVLGVQLDKTSLSNSVS